MTTNHASANRIPLAERMRPTSLDEVVGQEAIIGEGKILTQIVKNGEPVNLIFWGPPGTGKTTLARILAHEFHADFVELSAVTAGKKDIETVVERAKTNWNLKVRTVLFVDEIHRFNKAQQDAFLPHVESGLIILIGATTENPSFEIISPLLSRSRVVLVSTLKKSDILKVLRRALAAEHAEQRVTPEALDYIAELSGGDARSALGDLELSLGLADQVTPEVVETAVGQKMPLYDKSGDYHYDNISAFIKSMRGSDVDATLYYLARMVESGEDPKFIARRMVIFASEDIGLAGNGALNLAVSCFQAVEQSQEKPRLLRCLDPRPSRRPQIPRLPRPHLAPQRPHQTYERPRLRGRSEVGSWLPPRQKLPPRRSQRPADFLDFSPTPPYIIILAHSRQFVKHKRFHHIEPRHHLRP